MLNKFLNVQSHEFDEPVSTYIKDKQSELVQGLIEKLGPNSSEEDHLNAGSILQDVLENNKDYYSIICKKTNV